MQSYLQYRRFAKHPDIAKSISRQHAADWRRRQAPSEDAAKAQTRGAPLAWRDSESTVAASPSSDERANQGDKEKQNESSAKPDEDPFLVAFSSADPHAPHNWSRARRWLVTAIVAQIAIIVGVAASVSSVAAEQASADLGVSNEVYALETALFLIGFGLASPIVGPLSELGGRNPVYIGTLVGFLAFEIGAGFAQNIQTLVILRFFGGLFGSTPLSNAGGTMADIWSASERTYSFPVFACAGFVGPASGPVLGGFIAQSYLGWRWTHWITVFWGVGILLQCVFLLPETFEPTLLKMKADQVRRATGDRRHMSALEKKRQTRPFRADFAEAMKRPFLMFVYEPIVMFISLYMSVVYIILFGDFEAYPLVWQPFGFNTGQVGLAFITVTIGCLLALVPTPFVYKRYKRKQHQLRDEAESKDEAGCDPPPEERLVTAMFGTWLVPISMFWFAWTCYPTISPWPALVSQVFFGIGILTTFISSYQYVIDTYGTGAASALAAVTCVRYVVSGGAVMFTEPMYKSLGNHWAISLLAFISLATSFIPLVFYRYGERIRGWSRYSQHIS